MGVYLLSLRFYCGLPSMAIAMSNIDTFSVAYFDTRKSLLMYTPMKPCSQLYQISRVR